MNAAAAPQQLQYAPPPAWHRRRRWRWLGLLALIVAIAAVGIGSWKRLEPRVRERWQMIAAQSECLEHEAPAGSVVFYRDADTTYAAKPWTRTGPDSLVVPQEWVQYHGQYVGPSNPLVANMQSHGTLFLHERRSPSGNRRLVAVDVLVLWSEHWTALVAEKSAIVPGGILTDPDQTWGGRRSEGYASTDPTGQRQRMLEVPYGKTIRLLAGRSDRDDTSRFTIEYEIDGRRETIDGRLNDDETVQLELRNAADAVRPR